LEQKGDRNGALVEYRAALQLDSQDPDFRKAYERLSQPVKR